jgi:tetratricopeptide (TPR) repeat protein
MLKKIFSVLVVVTLLVSCAALIAQEKQEQNVSKKALRLMKKVDKAITAKEYDKALESCQKIMEMEPEYAAPHFKKGIILKEQKKYGEAASSLEKTLQLQAQYPGAGDALIETLNLLAGEMTTNKNPAKALELYLKIVGFSDAGEAGKRIQTEAYYQLGINFYRAKNPSLSNENLLKFVKTPGVEKDYKSSFIIANYIVGVNSYQLKLSAQSNEYLFKFLELSAANDTNKDWMPLAHFIIGANGFELLQEEVEKKDKTDLVGVANAAKEDKIIVANLSKALELGLNLEQIYLTLGNYYYYCRDIENAIKYYTLLIEKFPNARDITTYNDFLKQLEEDKKKK